MHPREGLFARPQRSADEELEGGQHFRQRPAAAAQHDAQPRRDHARAQGFGRVRLALPLPAERGEEVAALPGFLVDRALPGASVIADGRGVDQDLGAAVGLGNRGDQRARRLQPRARQRQLALGRPAPARHAFPAEIDHPVGAVERLRPRAGRTAVPNRFLDALRSPAGGAREHCDRVAAREQLGDQRASDEARASGQDDVHARIMDYARRRGRSGPAARRRLGRTQGLRRKAGRPGAADAARLADFAGVSIARGAAAPAAVAAERGRSRRLRAGAGGARVRPPAAPATAARSGRLR
jgi:hypothetical protein